MDGNAANLPLRVLHSLRRWIAYYGKLDDVPRMADLKRETYEFGLTVMVLCAATNCVTLFTQLLEHSLLFLFDACVLLIFAATLAAVHDIQKRTEQADSAAPNSVVAWEHSRLSAYVFFAFFAQAAKVVLNMLCFDRPWVATSFIMDLFMYFLMTALPFFVADHLPSHFTIPGLGCKIYALQNISLGTMVLGYLQYAHDTSNLATLLYFILCSTGLLCFMLVSANLAAIMFTSSVASNSDGVGRVLAIDVQLARGTSATMDIVIRLLVVLNISINAPFLVITVIMSSYSGNIGLSLNTLFCFFIMGYAAYMYSRENDAGDQNYIQIDP